MEFWARSRTWEQLCLSLWPERWPCTHRALSRAVEGNLSGTALRSLLLVMLTTAGTGSASALHAVSIPSVTRMLSSRLSEEGSTSLWVPRS